MNKSEAIRATRNGAIAACVSAAVTVVVAVIAISTDAGGKLAFFNDPFVFLDIALVLGCAFGMYRKSRVASVLLFVYFIASKIIVHAETQSYGGIGVALVFLYFYGRAVLGSFRYHQLEKEQDPDYKAATKWSYIVGIPAVLIVTVVIGGALISTTGVMPSTRVQDSSEIRTKDLATLRSHGIVGPDEYVHYFYSQGFSSILESGNILTEERVILYVTEEDDRVEIYEIPLNEVTGVVLESRGDMVNDSVYRVDTKDPERWLRLYLSVERKGDEEFVEALRKRLPR